MPSVVVQRGDGADPCSATPLCLLKGDAPSPTSGVVLTQHLQPQKPRGVFQEVSRTALERIFSDALIPSPRVIRYFGIIPGGNLEIYSGLEKGIKESLSFIVWTRSEQIILLGPFRFYLGTEHRPDDSRLLRVCEHPKHRFDVMEDRSLRIRVPRKGEIILS